jgi:hypothetical protein
MIKEQIRNRRPYNELIHIQIHAIGTIFAALSLLCLTCAAVNEILNHVILESEGRLRSQSVLQT